MRGESVGVFCLVFFVRLFARMELILGRNWDIFQAGGFLYLLLDIHLTVAGFNTRIV